jgi:hypothetical protein
MMSLFRYFSALVVFVFLLGEIVTGSYGAAVGAQHETHQRLSCGFHMEGPPQNKKGKEKKRKTRHK